ncbi:YdaU family protein [Bartonella sp. C271]|uniref:YdaU family protein n=1 Tax=Bartonella sp. C271 TaxID=3070220 RepID=UPI0038B507E3
MKQVLHSETPHYESSVLPYVCWYQNDFLGGVRGMRAHEIGIYTILLNEMYARGRPLDLSSERLARLCGCDKRTFEGVLEMLITEGKILHLASGLWNTRCEIVFHERAKLLEQKSFAGRSSAKKRKKIKEQFQHLLNASPLDAERNSEAQKSEEKETPHGVSQKKSSSVVSSTSFCDISSPKEEIKGSRLPSEWRADITTAISEGLSEEQALWQEKKFRDYWQAKSGKEAKKVDWSATWRNWYRREIERLQENDKRLSVLSSVAFSARSATALNNAQEETLYSSLINYQVS